MPLPTSQTVYVNGNSFRGVVDAIAFLASNIISEFSVVAFAATRIHSVLSISMLKQE